MSEPRAQRRVEPTSLPRPASAASTATPGLQPDDAFIVFAHGVLRREAAALTASKPRIETAPAPEEIHQLRVAARRLRVALRLFGRMLPSNDAARFRAELRWFASSLGEVRDLDVYAEAFKESVQALSADRRGGLSGYQLYLRRERAAARSRAAAAVASPRAAELLAALGRFAAAGPSKGALRRWGSLTVRDALRQNIRRSVGRVRRLGNALAARAARPAELHDLRIKVKRLRYELEFFADVYPPLKQAAKECKALQDLLGAHQDVYAGLARVRRYAALLRHQGGGALPPALAQLRKGQLAHARELRGSFRAKWPAFAAAIGAARKLVA
jgi:CHAD domain-containing protein